MRRLKKNRIQCKHCDDIIESKSEYDFKRFQYGKVEIDGGLEYCRRLYPVGEEEHIEDLSEFE